jgi:hypothetical protein
VIGYWGRGRESQVLKSKVESRREEKEEAAFSKGSAGVSPAVSRILRGTSSMEEVEPRMNAKERE